MLRYSCFALIQQSIIKVTMIKTVRPTLFQLILFVLIYGCLAWISIGVRDEKSLATLYWPAGGILLGALMISQIHRWKYWLSLAALIHFIGTLFLSPRSIPVALLLTLSELVSMSAIALIWQRRTTHKNTLTEPKNLLWFITLVLVINLIGGAVTIAILNLVGGHLHLMQSMTWALSSALGCLLGTPLVLAWSDFRIKRSGGLSWQDLGIGAFFFVAALISAILVFYGPFATQLVGTTLDEITYLPLLFVVLVAMAWEQRGVTLVLIPFALIAGICTLFHIGPFSVTQSFPGEALLDVQGYITAVALLALLMAAFNSSHQRSLQQAAAWKTRFEAALLSSRHLMYEFDPRDEKIHWGGDVNALLGTPAEALSSLEDFLQRVHPEDRAIVIEHARVKNLTPTADENVGTQSAYFRFKSADDRYLNIVASGAPIIDFDGQIYKVEGLLSHEETSPFMLPKVEKVKG